MTFRARSRRNWAACRICGIWTSAQTTFSGAIPPGLGGLSNLQHLDLDENDVFGPIPPELGGLSDLRHLRLSSNGLSGAIPSELGGLSNLEALYLERNTLSGAIPPELGGLSTLRHLHLDNNALSGAIPTTLLELPLLSFVWATRHHSSREWTSDLCAPAARSSCSGWMASGWSGALSANVGEAFATFGITEEGEGGERWTQRGMG